MWINVRACSHGTRSKPAPNESFASPEYTAHALRASQLSPFAQASRRRPASLPGFRLVLPNRRTASRSLLSTSVRGAQRTPPIQIPDRGNTETSTPQIMNSDPGLTASELDELEHIIVFELSQPALESGKTIEGEAYLKIAKLIHRKRLAAIQNLKVTGESQLEKDLREKGWSLRPAAERLGCHWSHLHRVLKGDRQSAKLVSRIHKLPRRSAGPAHFLRLSLSPDQ